MRTDFMAKIVKYRGYRYRIKSYSPTGQFVNAEFYYKLKKGGKLWHELKNWQIRLHLAKKFPKKKKKIPKRIK